MKKPSIVNQSHSRVYIFPNHLHPDTGEPASSKGWELVAKGLQLEIDNLRLQNLLYPKIIPRWYDTISQRKPIFAIINTLIETLELMITGIQIPVINGFEMLKLFRNDNALKYITVTISSTSISGVAYLRIGISPRGVRGVRVWGRYIFAHWNYSLRKRGSKRWVTSSTKIHPALQQRPVSDRSTNELKYRRC